MSCFISARNWRVVATLLLGVDAGVRYRAAVVEIGPTSIVPASPGAAWSAQKRNVEAMERWVREASRQGAQIVVFPEDYLDSGASLTAELTPLYSEMLPEPGPECLCKGRSPNSVAEAVACVAKKHGLIVVSGMGALGPCPTHLNPFNNKPFSCNKTTGLATYNAMAAFGREGQLLARYRKAHLAEAYTAPELEPWAALDWPEVVTFDSHFGVRFGMLICNDANFGGPTRGILKQGVRDILFSTYWINTSPNEMAVGFQDAYSRAHGVNLIAANSDGQGFASSGSGIWPADTSAPSLQRFNRTFFALPWEDGVSETEGWLGVLDLESPTVQKPIPAAVSHPVGAAQMGDVDTIKVVVATPNADGSVHVNSSVPGTTCQLDSSIVEGWGRFGLIATAGMQLTGWYSAMCSVVACPEGMDGPECARLLADCVGGFGGPQDCTQTMCAHAHAWASQAPSLGEVHLRIKAVGTNTFLPSALCSNYLTAEPRSKVSVTELAPDEQVLHVAGGACDALGAFSIEARAASEAEEPERRGTGAEARVIFA